MAVVLQAPEGTRGIAQRSEGEGVAASKLQEYGTPPYKICQFSIQDTVIQYGTGGSLGWKL